MTSAPMRLALSLVIGLAAGTAFAQQGVRDTDTRFSRSDLHDRLSGSTVEFFDDSRATYASDGSYEYRYQPGDPPFLGSWEATADSAVCVTFDNGFSRCDTFVISREERLTLIIESGDRYPVRTETPLN